MTDTILLHKRKKERCEITRIRPHADWHTRTHESRDINKKAPTQTQPTNQACLYCWWFSLYCVGFGGKQIELCGDKLATWQSFLLKAARQQQRCLISEGFSPSHTLRGADWELEFHLGVNGRMWTLLTLQLVWVEQRQYRGGSNQKFDYSALTWIVRIAEVRSKSSELHD